MPVDRGAASKSAAAGWQLAEGTYVTMLRSECTDKFRVDPRLFDVEALAGYSEACAAAGLRADELAEELLAAGKPIEVRYRAPRGANLPDWLSKHPSNGGASKVRIYSDDWAEPAAYYGERVGAVVREVAVPPQHRVVKKRQTR